MIHITRFLIRINDYVVRSPLGHFIGLLIDHIIDNSPLGEPLYSWLTQGVIENLHHKVVDEIVKLAPGTVLDVGTGNGRIPINVSQRSEGTVYGVDRNPSMIRKALKQSHGARLRGKLTFEIRSATDLGFDDDSFDLVLYTLTFHHLYAQQLGSSALVELKRVMKNGGQAWIIEFLKNAPLSEVLTYSLQSKGWRKVITPGAIRLHGFDSSTQLFSSLISLIKETGFDVSVKQQGISLWLILTKVSP